MFDVEVTGVDSLLSKLDTLDQTINRNTNDVLRSGAKIIQEEIKRTAPYDPTHAVGRRYPDEPHARTDVQVSNIRTSLGGLDKHVKVGFNKSHWRMYWHELGTIKMQGKHFMERSVETKRNEVLKEYTNGLQNIINRSGLGG